MAEAKRYFWLKLQHDFFDSKRIKKLRKMAGGDTYTIIYLKMQLLAIKSDGVIKWTGLENTVAEELALDLDETPEDIAVTLTYLVNCGLCETSDNTNFFFPYAIENTGCEGASAQRMRDLRARQKSLPKEVEASHCSTKCALGYGEKEIEKEKEIELENKEVKEENPVSSKRAPKNVALFREKFPDSLPEIRDHFEEWLTYKNEAGAQKTVYTETGMKKLISVCEKKIAEHGKDYVVGAIDLSIEKTWKGICWDAYDKANPTQTKQTVATKSAQAYNNRYKQREYSKEDFAEIERSLLYN